MERVEGLTLKAWLEQETPPWTERLRAFIEAGRGAPGRPRPGIVHRDFKPSNALVRLDGRVKVTDFGLARLEDPFSEGLTETGAVVGTPAFMAPEVAFGGVSPQSDQVQLLRRALRGAVWKPPFPTRSSVAGSLTPPTLPDSPIPEAIGKAILRGLATGPHGALPLDGRVAGDPPGPTRLAAAKAKAWSARRKALGAWVGAVVLLAAAWRARPLPSGAVLLSGPGSVVACPPLESGGPGQGWLGAAAASLACMRIAVHLGGSTARIRAPADSLGLSTNPTPDFPDDPYTQPDARPGPSRQPAPSMSASTGVCRRPPMTLRWS